MCTVPIAFDEQWRLQKKKRKKTHLNKRKQSWDQMHYDT